MQRITPCLWFDTQAEEAAKFYVSLFDDAKITDIRYLEGTPSGDHVALVFFQLEGQAYTAIDGGPQFPFTEAVSFMVTCEAQAELDVLWDRLTEGGDPAAQQCGWCKDRFGVSWQVVPAALWRYLGDPDPGRASRAMAAMLQMKKLDVAGLERAAAG